MLTWVHVCGMRLSEVQYSSDFCGSIDCTNLSDSEKPWKETHGLKCGQKSEGWGWTKTDSGRGWQHYFTTWDVRIDSPKCSQRLHVSSAVFGSIKANLQKWEETQTRLLTRVTFSHLPPSIYPSAHAPLSPLWSEMTVTHYMSVEYILGSHFQGGFRVTQCLMQRHAQGPKPGKYYVSK